jgi:hypothetical protein
MPDALEQFAKETTEEFLKNLPAEKRLQGLSPDELLAAMSPEMRAALAQRLKEDGSNRIPEPKEPDHNDEKS